MSCSVVIALLSLPVGCADSDNPISPIQRSWARPGTGVNSSVLDLTAYDNELIAGGQFTTAGIAATHVAVWRPH